MSSQPTTARGAGRAARSRRHLECLAIGLTGLTVGLAAVVLIDHWRFLRARQPVKVDGVDHLAWMRDNLPPGTAPADERLAKGSDVPGVNSAQGESIADWIARKLPEGAMAPDFLLHSLAGGREVRLSSFRGRKPVVLIFGSFGCDLFCADLDGLTRLYHAYKDRMEFCFVYVTDAPHPSVLAPERVTRNPRAEPAAQRLARIRLGLESMNVPFTCLAPPPGSEVEVAYHGFPRRLLLVSVDGRIVHDAGRGLVQPWNLAAFERLLQSLPAVGRPRARAADSHATPAGKPGVTPAAPAATTAAPGGGAAPARGGR
jgi:hypothetical protein